MKFISWTKFDNAHVLRFFGIGMMILAQASILPILLLAIYNHPSADDFYYGTLTAHAWADTGSLLETLKAALKTVRDTYYNWQGTFSGIFVMSLQPSIFGENWYSIGTVLILAGFLLGFLLLSKALFNRFLGKKQPYFYLIGFILFTASIQLAPFPRQSYFWFNGSAYYTLFHGLSMILLASVLMLQKTDRKPIVLLLTTLALVLAIFIGGGNYVTAVLTALVLIALLWYGWHTRSKNIFPSAMVLLALLLALGFSILAPGNSVRQAEIPHHPSLLKAVLLAFYHAGFYALKWSSLYVLGVFLVLMPFIASSVSSNNFTYKKPWLLPIGSFLLLSASFAPPIFGMGILPERVLNVNFYLFVMLVGINVFYFTGWLQKHGRSLKAPVLYLSIGTLTLLAAFAQEPDIAVKEALQSLVSGQARQYDAEAVARLKLFQDKKVQQVVVSEFSSKPSLLFINDFDRDPKNWKNESAATFYGKESVWLK